jgi:hypothetical protein
MPRQITSPLHIARHLLMSDSAWLLFVEIPTSGEGFFRLVRNGRHLAANGVTWQACSLEIELPAEDAEGSLGQLVVSLPNVSRIPMAYVELDDPATGRGEILGYPITCWLQHQSALAVFDPALSWRHTAVAAEASETVMKLECHHPAGAQRAPGRVFTRAEFPQLLAVGA